MQFSHITISSRETPLRESEQESAALQETLPLKWRWRAETQIEAAQSASQNRGRHVHTNFIGSPEYSETVRLIKIALDSAGLKACIRDAHLHLVGTPGHLVYSLAREIATHYITIQNMPKNHKTLHFDHVMESFSKFS